MKSRSLSKVKNGSINNWNCFITTATTSSPPRSKSWSNWIFTWIILVTCGGLKVAYYSDTAPKRGRPRLRYPMSDFDLSLIREFRSRPAFYDRNSPLFKDKAFNGQAWQEISNILGYDVALLKDRMLQLRNRYNLEKRRLEQLAEENPGKYTSSPWPLYDHLGFLSDHIRSRRSFKRMLPRQSSMELNMSGGVGGSGIGRGGGGSCGGGGGGGSSTNMSPQPAFSADYSETPSTNGFLTVKMENTADVETDSQSGTDVGAGDEDNMHVSVGHVVAPAAAVTSANVSHQNSISNNISHTSTTALPALPTIQQSISIRNLDSMRTIIPMHNSHSNNNNNHSNNSYRLNNHHNDTHFTRSSNIRSEAISVVPEKKRCLSAREQKYEAFGQFVASSLGEMPKQQALLLVENFTKEVVRVLIEKNSTESSASPNISRRSPSSGGSGLANTCSSINQKEELLQVSTQQQRQAN